MKNSRLTILLSTSTVVVALILFLVSISLAGSHEPCGSSSHSVEGPAFDPENVCAKYTLQDGPITNLAMQYPDKFAWEKFAELNQPAVNKAGHDVVWWRTWPEQANVYVADPNPDDPPQWEDISGLDHLIAGHTSVQQAAKKSDTTFSEFSDGTIDEECIKLNKNQSEEVRLNQEHVEYVVANDLWYVEGKQVAFAKDLKVNFPTNAIEVKANWIKLSDDHDATTYYTVEDSQENTWGLVAMHFMTKDIPNWVWATFEHKDNPCYSRYLKAEDNFGLDGNGEPSEALLEVFEKYGLDTDLWSNYRLDGTQVTFTDGVGRPIILGNSVTEFGFQTTASCMTCHARATTDHTGAGTLSVFIPGTHNQSYHGTPDPEWYFSSFNPPLRNYLPVDFSWAVALCPNAIGSTTQNCPLRAVDQ